MIPESFNNFCIYFLHSIVQVNKVFPKIVMSKFSILGCKIALVQTSKFIFTQSDESFDINIIRKKFSFVFDLNSVISYIGVRKKNDSVSFFHLGGQVNKISVWRFPYTMKFGFNKNVFPDVNAPTVSLFTAVR